MTADKVCLLNVQNSQSPTTIETTDFFFHSLDLIIVTENCLYPEIKDSEVFPLNFDYSIITRRDRSGGEHGGVLIAAKRGCSFNYSEK